jgi:hypothetical protein
LCIYSKVKKCPKHTPLNRAVTFIVIAGGEKHFEEQKYLEYSGKPIPIQTLTTSALHDFGILAEDDFKADIHITFSRGYESGKCTQAVQGGLLGGRGS